MRRNRACYMSETAIYRCILSHFRGRGGREVMMKKLNIPPLNETIHALEDSIITLSGPALAISGIIAGVDLVTGGNMLKSVGWLALAWAICLLLTLGFQVLAF